MKNNSFEPNNYTASKVKCCENCIHFDFRTHFCRLKPPIPMVFYIDGKQNVSSKFPTITLPRVDFCSEFKISQNDNETNIP